MTEPQYPSYEIAVRDFHQARRDAAMQQMVARLQGKSADLLCFDEVRRHLRGGPAVERGLQEIPLDKIVGSVGRYQDFTRSFLPKKDSDEVRWATVRAAINDMKGMPPIEVYQIGEVYFVKDGNHRVSVARQLGTTTISAYVTEIETRVPLTADDNPDEVICKAGYADFLEKTNLDHHFPKADLLMTISGHYQVMLDQITVECRLLGGDEEMDCESADWEQAVVKWYRDVYKPMVRIIREVGLMRRFPDKTETDIYVYLSERREELEEAMGWRISPQTAAAELMYQEPSRWPISRVLDAVAPGLEEGPATGRWREQQQALQREQRLFEKILVILEGIEGDWQILDQVIEMAKKDHDDILGLHVVRDKAAARGEAVQQIRAEFERRCRAAGLSSEFAVDTGRLNEAIIKRAAWVDLVVINLTNPPEAQPLARLRPGWGTLIQRCPRPILAIPNAVHFKMDRLLLAYDGSPKAAEALFVAAYLASRWGYALVVVTVGTAYTETTALERAQEYLEQRGVTWADYVLREPPINEAILETAAEYDSSMLIMGGFGWRPVVRVVLGSTVEHMLREFKKPMLICR